MKLKRLIIHGFKSFKDKTVIHFDDGITGIVGPNGCGKSNIVDALFWVMGEQSAKHLRGTKMQDLIFSGSSKYNPSTWAEVSLVLSNDEGKHIHIGNKLAKPSEIQITRKLYKNGDTEYRINDFPCRLKDIHEVFMDTGAGAKSYSIIAQGEINRLVQAKPVERRAMIEEVAGVTKFKVRRKESLKKIESTQINLDRLNDLQTEVYKQLKKLESQSEKAQRAKTLKDKLTKHELIVASHKEFDLLTSYQDLKKGMEEAENSLVELRAHKDNIEVSLADERIRKDELLDELNSFQAKYNEGSKALAASEEKLNYFIKSREAKEETHQSLAEEIEEIKDHLEGRKQRLSEVQEELSSLENESTGGVDLSELKLKVEELESVKTAHKEELFELENSLDDSKKELSDINLNLAGVEVRAQEFSNALENLTVEIEDLEKETSSRLNSITEEKDKLEKITEKRSVANLQLQELSEKFANIKEKVKKVEIEVREQSKIHIQAKSKLESLKAIQDNVLGEGDTYQNLFETFTNKEALRLGEIIESDSSFGQCVDSLLSECGSLILSKDKDVLSWINDFSNPRIDLVKESTPFAKSNETIERLETLGAQGIVDVNSVLKITNTDWEKTLKDFFDGFYIVENLSPSLMDDISSSINFKGLVSKDGSCILIKNNGLVLKRFKGSQEGKVSYVQRNNEITSLEGNILTLEAELATKTIEFEALSLEKENISDALESARESYNEINSLYHAEKSSYEMKKNFTDNNSLKLKRLLEKKSETSSRKLSLVEEEERLSSLKEDMTDKINDLLEKVADKKEAYNESMFKFEAEKEEYLSLKLQADSFEGRKLSIKSMAADLEKDISRSEEKLLNLTDKKEQTFEEFTQMSEEMETLREQNLEKAESLKDEEDSLRNMKDLVESVIQAMQEREEDVKTSVSKINSLEKELAVANARVEQIYSEEDVLTKDIFERYQVNLRDVISSHISLETKLCSELTDISSLFVMETEEGEITIEAKAYEFEKRFPGQVKESRDKFNRYKQELNRLGEINWQAVEDYDRQKIRYDFLRKQEEELKGSLNDLQMAIDHIDEKSRARFQEAFDEVNTRFVKVFPIIFGGGSATLKLVGSIDDPESGIDIIAQPPGKKMQNINLMSGGEKAMTAVSLIFSIFLVKPSPFCLLDEVDAPLDDANVGRFNELLREMSSESQFILITHNKKTMELNDVLYGVTMQEPGISKAISVQLQ